MIGRLGQRHADMLEAVQFCAERRLDEESGSVKLLVDPARIRKLMSDHRYSLEQCWTILKELCGCVIEIETPKIRIMGGIIESAEYTKSVTRPDPLTGGQRRLWTIRLGKAWIELMRLDMTYNGNPELIILLKSGISKAVARFMLTHSMQRQPNGGWMLDSVIHAVAGNLDVSRMKKARHRLRCEASALHKIGVQIAIDRVYLVPQPPDEVPQPPDEVPQPPTFFRFI